MSRLFSVFLAAMLVAGSIEAASATTKKRPPARKKTTKVSGAQLFKRLDTMDRRIQDLHNAFIAGKGKKLVVPRPSGGMPSRELAQSLYDAGVYHKRAAKLRRTSKLIRAFTLVTGSCMMLAGYEESRDKFADHPRTIPNAFSQYAYFSTGLVIAVLGVGIGEILSMSADGADAKAGEALKQPLQKLPTETP